MYPVVLFIHSWLRWVVLLLSLLVIVRAWRGRSTGGAWQTADERSSVALLHVANLQFTLGLLLYLWLSPIVRSAFADMAVAMKSAPLRFFAIEHITAMTIAVSVLSIGRARTRKAEGDALKHQRSLRWTAAFMLCTFIGIPWPELKHGRPLARTQIFEPGSDVTADAAPELYIKRCAACHGAGGHGDGLAAAAMQPKPRDFADGEWRKRVTDLELTQVIQQGGLSRQLSASMPPHPDLSFAQVQELVRFIRSVKR